MGKLILLDSLLQEKNKMNQEKLKQLQAQVRIGGKGTARRKKKVVHRTATTDDKKLQSSLKKLSVNNIPGIEEVNMIKDDGTVIHFNNPKVQASLAANTFAVTGHAENKQITEMLPGILNQLGAESLTHLKRLASNVTGGGTGAMEPGLEDDDDDEVPDLVENFDEVSKLRTTLKLKRHNPMAMKDKRKSKQNIHKSIFRRIFRMFLSSDSLIQSEVFQVCLFCVQYIIFYRKLKIK